jgi:hypothetical protein
MEMERNMLRNLRTGLNIRDERFKTYGTDGRIFLETHGTEGVKTYGTDGRIFLETHGTEGVKTYGTDGRIF